MSPECQRAVVDVGNGVGASLRGVDCLAADMTQAAFGRLFGSQGALVPALTLILTIYVALFGFALITGRSRIGIRALMPRMVTVGLVITFTTSWLAYQTYVWGFFTGAPDQIAALLLGGEGSATQQFGDKIDIVFAAIQQASGNASHAAAGGAAAGGAVGPPADISTFSPQGMMWMGATLLLLGTVGVLVTARIALAVLMALGPIFIVLSLFPATRGLFAGWLRGMVMMAVTPLFAVLGGTLMLELAVPVINALGVEPGKIDPRAAMAFFLVGAVHAALMVMVLKVGATMVGNWTVFGLAGSGGREPADASPAPAAASAAAIQIEHAAAVAAAQSSPAPRRLAISGIAAGTAANDIAGSAVHTRSSETVVHAASGGSAGPLPSSVSRARGIGSRFRSAPPRLSEKLR